MNTRTEGVRVCTGSDSGFIYKLYGFGYIRELKLQQEAGLHPLEVVRSATLCGAETLHKPEGKPIEFGLVKPGMLADPVVVKENPIHNPKILYGTGTVKLDKDGRPVRVGGVKYTVKDGIVYDAKRLLANVARMVEQAKGTTATGSGPSNFFISREVTMKHYKTGLLVCVAALGAGVVPPALAAQESGVEVEAVLARAIEDRQPVDTGSSFPADVGRVWLWTKVTGAAGQTVTHVWSHGDNEWEVPLQIGAETWRTWSNKTIPPEWTGEWQVEVRDQAGNVLKTVRFTVGSGG